MADEPRKARSCAEPTCGGRRRASTTQQTEAKRDMVSIVGSGALKNPYAGRGWRLAAKTPPFSRLLRLAGALTLACGLAAPAHALNTKEGEFTLRDFHFRSGERL